MCSHHAVSHLSITHGCDTWCTTLSTCLYTHKHPTLAHNIFMQGLHTKELESGLGKESPKEFGDALTCVIGPIKRCGPTG